MMRAGGSLGTFDLIGICHTDIVLCQVKTRDWPGKVETDAIRAFRAPRNARKVLHRWRDGECEPDVRVVE